MKEIIRYKLDRVKNEYNQSWYDKDIEKLNDQWKVLYVHCSFEPEK